jgi:hypothetical protein
VELKEYCAGLWEGDLINQLGWRVDYVFLSPPSKDPPANSNAALEGYRGPSWSWASVDKAVRVPDFKDGPESRAKFRAEIVSINCKAATENPFGPVTPGSYIDIKVMLIPATLHIAGRGKRAFSLRGKPWEQSGYDPNLIFGSGITLDEVGELHTQRDLSLAVIQVVPAAIKMMPEKRGKMMLYRNLILEACEVDGMECFRRIGFLEDEMDEMTMGKVSAFTEPVIIRII